MRLDGIDRALNSTVERLYACFPAQENAFKISGIGSTRSQCALAGVDLALMERQARRVASVFHQRDAFALYNLGRLFGRGGTIRPGRISMRVSPWSCSSCCCSPSERRRAPHCAPRITTRSSEQSAAASFACPLAVLGASLPQPVTFPFSILYCLNHFPSPPPSSAGVLLVSLCPRPRRYRTSARILLRTYLTLYHCFVLGRVQTCRTPRSARIHFIRATPALVA